MNKTVDDYLEKQGLSQREICQKLREIIFKTIPSIKEGMKWGVPSYADGRYYLVTLRAHVNLGFSLEVLSKQARAQALVLLTEFTGN